MKHPIDDFPDQCVTNCYVGGCFQRIFGKPARFQVRKDVDGETYMLLRISEEDFQRLYKAGAYKKVA